MAATGAGDLCLGTKQEAERKVAPDEECIELDAAPGLVGSYFCESQLLQELPNIGVDFLLWANATDGLHLDVQQLDLFCYSDASLDHFERHAFRIDP